jgi:hypothetical protein
VIFTRLSQLFYTLYLKWRLPALYVDLGPKMLVEE